MSLPSRSLGIRLAICGAIWSNTCLPARQRNLPANFTDQGLYISSRFDAQLEYPVGSPARLAIQESYGYAQPWMLAVGTGIMALCFV